MPSEQVSSTKQETLSGTLEQIFSALSRQNELCSALEEKVNLLFGVIPKDPNDDLAAKKPSPSSIRDAVREIQYRIQTNNRRLDDFANRLNDL